MPKVSPAVALALALLACRSDIKNPDAAVVVEPGTRADTAAAKTRPSVQIGGQAVFATPYHGFWVGDFEPAAEHRQGRIVYTGEHTAWTRTNKINISIDSTRGETVYGHSVVAGNDRPFGGSLSVGADGVTHFVVEEPGDDRYDGTFRFVIEGERLTGTWEAFKKIEIPRRTYTLHRREFAYDPNAELKLGQRYVDWNRYREDTVPAEVLEESGEVSAWMEKYYAASTDAAYRLNASAERLSEAQVSNLKRGDLVIIRNAIYARHGYSFRERPLRAFFDQQEWYIPVHADITTDFTPVELANIKLLLRYEGNAAEYYDRFGRG